MNHLYTYISYIKPMFFNYMYSDSIVNSQGSLFISIIFTTRYYSKRQKRTKLYLKMETRKEPNSLQCNLGGHCSIREPVGQWVEKKVRIVVLQVKVKHIANLVKKLVHVYTVCTWLSLLRLYFTHTQHG